jgi:FkbM family methyltransferase
LSTSKTGGEKSLEMFAKANEVKGNVLDMGANIGYFSLLLSKYSPSSVIYAIEPGEKNSEYLEANIVNCKLSNVTSIKVAISNYIGHQEFMEDSAWGTLVQNELTENKSLDQDSTELVRVATTDDLVATLGLTNLELIKIDIEGFEFQAFEGMQMTIEKFNPKIIFEYNSYCIVAYGKRNPIEFLNFVEKKFRNIHIFKHKFDENSELTESVDRNDFGIRHFHNNVVYNGSVDNFLVWN